MVHKSDDGKIAVIGALYEFGKPDYFLSKVSKYCNRLRLDFYIYSICSSGLLFN